MYSFLHYCHSWESLRCKWSVWWLFEIQASLALMLPVAPPLISQTVMQHCSVQAGRPQLLLAVVASSQPRLPGLRRTTPNRTGQHTMRPPQPSLLTCTCRLCAPATPCWPTPTHHCSLTLGWVGLLTALLHQGEVDLKYRWCCCSYVLTTNLWWVGCNVLSTYMNWLLLIKDHKPPLRQHLYET